LNRRILAGALQVTDWGIFKLDDSQSQTRNPEISNWTGYRRRDSPI
jgi:hypothetical protein